MSGYRESRVAPQPRRYRAVAAIQRATVLGLFLSLPTSPSFAEGTPWVGDAHASVRLVTAVDGQDGQPLEAGLEFRFAPGWHGYWRTPGDAGVPPTIDWSGTPDLERADVSWPAPSRLVISNLQNAVYEGRVVLPVRLVFGRKLSPGSAQPVHATVDYAACSNICVPYHADLALDLAAGAARPSSESASLAEARAALPSDPSGAGLSIVRDEIIGSGADRRLVIGVESPAGVLAHPDLFVEGFGGGLPPAPAVEIEGEGHAATLVVSLPANAEEGPSSPLRLTVVDGTTSASFDGPALPTVQARSPDAPLPTPAGNAAGLLAAAVSALVGGLILNLMPCVLPILSLKLAGLASQAGMDRRAARAGFAATGAGILASFGLLAFGLIAVKATGRAVGWGIQFQQPAFLAAMAILTVTFAASMFDWLHVGLPARLQNGGALTGGRATWSQHFALGMLATLLATPCSAPFVGTAAGFALAGGPGDILTIFACLGLGMALPYFAAAAVPVVTLCLPRPGPWMITLRRVLGLLLLGTAVWLLLLIAGVAGPSPAGSVAVAVGAWLAFLGWSARALPIDSRSRPRAAAFALAVLAAAVALAPTARADRAPRGSGDVAFDPAAIAPIVSRGGTVLVDVSAAWCLTCKVNEFAALGSGRVRDRLAAPGTVVMHADWTRPDPGISRYLASFGRYGIPLDVVYGPGRPAGEPLPELLTPGTVVAALDRAAGRSPDSPAPAIDAQR